MKDFDGWCERARAWLRQGRYREAELAYREAIGLRPDDVKLRLDLALVLRRQRRSADAEAILRDVVALRPDLASAHAELGAVLFELGRYREAAVAFREATRVRPDFARAHLGTVLRRQRRSGDAEAVYRDGVTRGGGVQSHVDLGRTLFEQRRYAEAAVAFREGIRLGGADGQVRIALARTLERLGQVHEAIAAYREA